MALESAGGLALADFVSVFATLKSDLVPPGSACAHHPFSLILTTTAPPNPDRTIFRKGRNIVIHPTNNRTYPEVGAATLSLSVSSSRSDDEGEPFSALDVYELNRIELLRDVFVWAYERSCARYAAVRRSLGDPDPFRLRYRELIAQIVSTIIRERMDREKAIGFIRREAGNAPSEDRSRLIEITETEIMSLHEGNFARYRVRPSEYEAWRASWR